MTAVLVRTSVGLKAVMAVSGLILIGYLLAHKYGNLKVFAGPESCNRSAHPQRKLGEPAPRYGRL